MFTNNWFEITAKKNFEKYLLPISNMGLNFLEVGCYEGQASCWLMENTDGTLTVIDTFKGGADLPDEVNLFDRFKENTKAHEDRIKIKVGNSRTQLKSLKDSFHLIYIDASHTASDTLEDAVLSFPLLESGGLMIFDDYTWGQGMSPYDVPKTGIDAFVSAYGNQLEVLEQNSQMVIRKK